MSEVIILSGIPGSGKTTHAQREYPAHIHLSTDDYWINENGDYDFVAEDISKAHAWNLLRFIDEVSAGALPEGHRIVVDNTNLSVAEIAPYYALAEAYGCSVKIVIVMCSLEVAMARQTHGVPEEAIVKMFNSSLGLERALPPWWKYVRVVDSSYVESSTTVLQVIASHGYTTRPLGNGWEIELIDSDGVVAATLTPRSVWPWLIEKYPEKNYQNRVEVGA